jgi:hypothetical protein
VHAQIVDVELVRHGVGALKAQGHRLAGLDADRAAAQILVIPERGRRALGCAIIIEVSNVLLLEG